MNAVTLPQLPEVAYTSLGSEVYRGLTSRPRTLSPWLFYDQEGSHLFEQITELDEYYLTRTERAIFQTNADAIIAAAAAPTPHGLQRDLTVIELGAGTATKTGLLLEAAVRRQEAVTYYGIDVSESALHQAHQNLTAAIPGVTFESRVGDYTEGLGEIPTDGTRRLVLYIGSSLGNFEPADASQLLRDIRNQLAPGDMLLLGVDMTKDIPTLIAAYDDPRRHHRCLQPQRTGTHQPRAWCGLRSHEVPPQGTVERRALPHRDAPRKPHGARSVHPLAGSLPRLPAR